jgi:Skp family chaperone for outer membrane proteins
MNKIKIRFQANFLYNQFINLSKNMSQISRQEFTDKVQDYIKRINQIAEEQGYSVMMAYYIE